VSRFRAAPQRHSPRAAAFTSVSKATGSPSVWRNGPARSTFFQPGLGVEVMKPNVGDDGARSTGPNDPMPIPASGPRRVCASRKKAMAWPMVSAGLVVGSRASARTSSGPVPTTQTNLVPPPSTPP
jgi:hypothetical protein